MIGLLTGSTCGDMCWYAREDVCHCSCGGANHGCLRSKDGVQPIRTARIDGQMCELYAVGYGLDKDAQALNKAAGCTFMYAHTARQHYGESPVALMRKSTEAQVSKWPELVAYRPNLKDVWRAANPNGCYAEWPGLPYIIWRVKP